MRGQGFGQVDVWFIVLSILALLYSGSSMSLNFEFRCFLILIHSYVSGSFKGWTYVYSIESVQSTFVEREETNSVL